MGLQHGDLFLVAREPHSYRVKLERLEDQYGLGDQPYISTPLVLGPQKGAGIGDLYDESVDPYGVVITVSPIGGRLVTFSSAEFKFFDHNGDPLPDLDFTTFDDPSLGIAMDDDVFEINKIYEVIVRYTSVEGLTSEFSDRGHRFRFGDPSVAPTMVDADEIFFNENTYMPITRSEVTRKYGLAPENFSLAKVFPLSEQPDYPVLGYTKKKDKYVPIRDYSADVESLKSAIAAVKTQIRAQT